MRVLACGIGLLWSVTALANHGYGGLDLCTLYPEIMPPGLDPALLPQPQSRGARLLQSYCTQCHKLPGPGRHTAGEWPPVLERMNLLMDVASRFGGLLGKVAAPGAEEREVLAAYLEGNALQAMPGEPRGMGAAAFTSHCGACHALPDAGQHTLEGWSAVLKRMQRDMTVMRYPPPSQEVMLQIQRYLQQQVPEEQGTRTGNSDQELPGNSAGQGGLDAHDLLNGERWMALGPFLLLMIVGLARWWRSRT